MPTYRNMAMILLMISMQHSFRLQTSASRKSLKDTEQQLKDVNEQIEKVKDL